MAVALPEGRAGADVRQWPPSTRRSSSLWVLTLSVLVLLAAVLVYVYAEEQAGWVMWTAIVVLALLLLFELAVVATGVARESGGPTWLSGLPEGVAAPPPGDAAEAEHVHTGPHIDLKCPECANIFTAHDTGERPLHTTCPHCGAEGHVDDLPAPEPAPAAAYEAPAAEPEPEPEQEPEPPAAEGPTISLKCPACATQFSVEDTGERPLRAVCPGCGKGGRLR